MTPTLLPPDLELRVTARDDGGTLGLDYGLHSPNGRFELTYVPFPGGRLHLPDAWQQRIFKTLDKLHRGLDSRDAMLTATDVATELAALGEDLCDELFPPQLQRTLQEVREAETILLISDEPWIPWELVKPYEGCEDQGDDGFLASRQLTRWLAGGRTPVADINVDRLAVVEAGSPPDLQALTNADDELRFLGKLAARHGLEADVGNPRFLPYLSLHEFEALLLTSPSEVGAAFPERVDRLAAMVGSAASPEEINDGPDTHPAARIARLLPTCRKPLHGPMIASRIGLGPIRRRCPHFDGWVSRLEEIGKLPPGRCSSQRLPRP